MNYRQHKIAAWRLCRLKRENYAASMNVRICPKCFGTDVDRSTTRGLYERLVLRAKGKRPFRCAECRFRYYDHANAQRILICDISVQSNLKATAAEPESRAIGTPL